MSESMSAAAPETPPPSRPIGQQRGVGFVIVLWIVTLGIYAIYWLYKSYEEVRAYRGQGVNGVVGVLLGLIAVSYFLFPQYVGKMYQEDGKPNPVSGMTGFWIFLPYAGAFVWLWKVQTALNEFWASKGAPPPS